MKHKLGVLVTTAALISLASGARDPPQAVQVSGDVSPIHDPVLIEDKGNWFLFATGATIRRLTDLHKWKEEGKVFDPLPAWTSTEIPASHGGYWAPDISLYKGVYRLYYAVSTFGKNESAIGLATNNTLDPNSPDYHWTDQNMVLRSHARDDYNAIDPNLAVDSHGGHWLVFGSFWGGIKMRRIDATTGKLDRRDPRLYTLASRRQPGSRNNPIEAPFLVRHGSYYYLFVSFDYCCRGANSTYYVAVGRSSAITGPYRDAQGRAMLQGGGTAITASTSLWRGHGHEGIFLGRGGLDLMVFHAYDAKSGKPYLRISTMTWEGGWPKVARLPGEPLTH